MKCSLTAFIFLVTALLVFGRPLGEGDPQSLALTGQYHCGYPSNARHNANIGKQYAYNSAKEGALTGDPWEDGKSGYPHEFHNNEEIIWGVDSCDNLEGATLYEYPLYDDNKSISQKDIKRNAWNYNRPSPYRVTYRNKNGGILICGVMAHEKQIWLNKGWAGYGDFYKCQPV
ncbi:hypothetical protein KC363_g7603 [Hortaea werneckii]|nr:hypothetical protein KC363_g7603 [Hortaea werneckii]